MWPPATLDAWIAADMIPFAIGSRWPLRRPASSTTTYWVLGLPTQLQPDTTEGLRLASLPW